MRRGKSERTAAAALLALTAALLLFLSEGTDPAVSAVESGGQTSAVRLKKYTATFVGAMDTVTTLTAWCADEAVFQRASDAAGEELNRLSALYDRYAPDSALSRLNGAGGQAVPIPEELSELLRYCREENDRYPGFSIALGRVTDLWEQARQTGRLPAQQELREAGRHTDLSDLRLEGETAALDDPELCLDLGGVAKGDAADRVAALLYSQGLDCFLLSCGESSLVCAGTPPDGNWKVGVRYPDAVLNLSGTENPPALLGTLSLSGRCIAVSGDYQQYFCADGTYYSHLIDPETLYPARYYRCVCVLADTAREAEIASKSLFVAPPERARAIAAREGLSALWVRPDGTVITTADFPGKGSWEPEE